MIGTSLTESLEGTCRRRRRAGAGRLGALLLLVLAARPIPATAQVAARRTAPLLMARPATAQTCFADTGNLPGNISCTANDVQTSLIVTPVGGDTCDSRVDTITLDLVITWHANADRYDIGLFVAEDGGNAKTGVCEQIVGQFPPFADLDDSSTSGDTCGDIEGGTDVVEHETVTVSCGAADANNHLLVPICTTWKQPGDNGLCLGINDTAGTSSKCDCFLWSTDVPVPPDPCANINCAAFDTGCTTASCDPGGAAGNCDVTTPKPSGTSCGNPTPTDAQCDAPDTCDGAGTCQSNNVVGICGDAGSDCVNQDYCQGGVCVDAGFKASGTACGNSSSGPCDAADTCNGAGSCQANNAPDGTNCGDAGSACVNQDTCLAGACHDNGFKAAGIACGDPSSGQCDGPDTCDGAGSCQANHAADGTNCGDAGTQCTNQDTCLAGACHDNGFKAVGTACGSSSSGQCDDPDTCDGSGTCTPNHKPDGTNCGDAGTQCTNQDTCLAGACHDNGFKAAGTACGDPSSGVCDNPDTCNGSGTCNPNYQPAGTVCRPSTNQDCNPAEVCTGNSPICPADTGDVCGFRDIPQMAITGTTCQQFTGGTSVTEGPVLYTLLNNAINSVAPGVFFLYDGIHLAATGTIAVTESEGSWSHAIGVQQSQVILYNLSCTRLTVGKIQVGTNGNVTITGVPAGNYILSVKYDPTTLNGYKPPTVNSTYTYSVTAGGLTSGNGSVFVDKKH